MKNIIVFLLLMGILVPAAHAETYQITTTRNERIELKFDPPVLSDSITRLPGPQHGYHCLMCLYNHLVGTHGQASNYLNRNGYGSWSTIHDNLHNDPSFKGERGPGYYTGYNLPAGRNPTVITSSFAPTPLDICDEMLEMADPVVDDVLYDLGCGDGRFLILASLKYGCRSVGIDIDSRCVELTRKYIRRYGLEDLVTVYHMDASEATIPEASIVVMYLMPQQSTQMKSIIPSRARVLVHDMSLTDWAFTEMRVKSSQVDGKRHRMFLYQSKEN